VEITEVRIKLMENSEDRLRGFCSITFDDCFVIRDLKIIEGDNGPFVAMPSRKLTSNCPKCRTKNHLRARFCNYCGARQKVDQLPHDPDGRARLYADIAHPINAACREMIQSRVIEEFCSELDRAKQPGYVSRYDDEYHSFEGEATRARQTSISRTDRAEDPIGGRHADPGNSVQSEISPQSEPRTESENKADFGKGILD
jgi:stage V sporulation protein G